jgi:hypothetical protein
MPSSYANSSLAQYVQAVATHGQGQGRGGGMGRGGERERERERERGGSLLATLPWEDILLLLRFMHKYVNYCLLFHIYTTLLQL